MKRKFNTFSQIGIKNKDTEKDFHIPKYRNRSQTSETIKPEQELPFDIGAFGSSAYYYKNTLGRNVEVSDLYDDGDEPVPVGTIRVVNNSAFTLEIYESFKDDIHQDNKYFVNPNESYDLKYNVDADAYTFYIRDSVDDLTAHFAGRYSRSDYDLDLTVVIQEGETKIYRPSGEVARWYLEEGDYGTLTVHSEQPHEKKYIYYKGEDSDVEFSLMISSSWDKVSVGTNLTVGTIYTISPKVIGGKFDMFINGFSVATYVEEYTFTLTEDMSVDGKVIITVRKHGGGANPKLRVENSNSYMTRISMYTEDYQWIEDIASFNRGESGVVDIPLNAIIGIGGMNFQARFSGTYGGIEYNNQKLTVEGSNYVYAPDGHRFWDNFQDGDEGNLIT